MKPPPQTTARNGPPGPDATPATMTATENHAQKKAGPARPRQPGQETR